MVVGFDLLQAESIQALYEQWMLKDRIPSTFRFGFSERIMMVDAFEDWLSAMKALREAEDKPWAEFLALRTRVYVEFAENPNHLTRKIYEVMGNATDPRDSREPARQGRAQLRLLRAAVHYRAMGEVLDLEDPFGGKMRSLTTGSRLRLWSVGQDGVDDGGQGEWDPKKGKDIVLEVER